MNTLVRYTYMYDKKPTCWKKPDDINYLQVIKSIRELVKYIANDDYDEYGVKDKISSFAYLEQQIGYVI